MPKKSYYTGCHNDFYYVDNLDKYMFQEAREWVECPKCKGAGNIHGVTCPFCKGAGQIEQLAVNYKSDWERKVFIFCDHNPFVTKWGYEPFAISYFSPVQMKQSIYKPDVYVECQDADGTEEKWLIEVKPVAYSVMPQAPKPVVEGATAKQIANYQKRNLAYQRKSMDVATNYAKWEAAEKWCQQHGVNWLILNESNTMGLFNPGKSV